VASAYKQHVAAASNNGIAASAGAYLKHQNGIAYGAGENKRRSGRWRWRNGGASGGGKRRVWHPIFIA